MEPFSKRQSQSVRLASLSLLNTNSISSMPPARASKTKEYVPLISPPKLLALHFRFLPLLDSCILSFRLLPFPFFALTSSQFVDLWYLDIVSVDFGEAGKVRSKNENLFRALFSHAAFALLSSLSVGLCPLFALSSALRTLFHRFFLRYYPRVCG